jgi:peptide/nickel transport system substrate-binding protein
LVALPWLFAAAASWEASRAGQAPEPPRAEARRPGQAPQLPRAEAPRPGEAPQPVTPIDASELLRSIPFDRITLTDGTVLVIDPVSPRPLPAFDPTKERERKRRASENPKVKLMEVGRDSGAAEEKEPELNSAAAESVDEITIHVLAGLDGDLRDYKVKRANIKKIEYFEDLLLQEADRLVLARDFARAFECCLRVQARSPIWTHLGEHVNSVLFAEGSNALLEGDGERGLRLLRELLARKPDYPGLLDQLGNAYGKQIERALAQGFFASGRRVLHDLEEIAPGHLMARAMRGRFIARARERLREAESARGTARLDGLEEAFRIWPSIAGAADAYRSAFAETPTLDVGVTDVPFPLGPWIHSPADSRVVPLLYRPILARDDPDARQGKGPPQLAAVLETSDLGRRMLIRIRPGFVWSDGSRSASAIDVAHALIDRSDPHSPNFEARWADLLDRVETPDDGRIELRLNYTPLRAGGWLLGPVGPAHAGIDGRIATSTRERILITNGPFQCTVATEQAVELRPSDRMAATPPFPSAAQAAAPSASSAAQAAATPAPGAGRPRIRRVREFRFAKGQTALAALLRGDVALVDHVPPDQVGRLAEASEIQVGRYAEPVVHVIALDGRNPALRSRALRRGLSYAIDRVGLLEGTVLKRPISDADAPADGPFAKGSYADAAGVKPLVFDALLARMLVAAARRELGGAPIALKLEYPALPESRVVAQKLADAFRLAGVEVTTFELTQSRLETELRAGRRFDLAYRVIRIEEPVLDAGPALCPGYDAPPEADSLASAASPRILQLLLELEHAADWPTARGLAAQLDREAKDELPVIPLWQLVDHFAWRTRLKGPEMVTDSLYAGLSTWEIAPWIPRDPWESQEKADAP